MKKIQKRSCALFAGVFASLMMLSVPVVAQASTVNAEAETAITQAATQTEPTAKDLKATLISVSYNQKNAELSYKIKFTNTSTKEIVKAKIHTVSELGETVEKDKTVTLNLKSNQTKTVTVSLGKVVSKPYKRDCSVIVEKIYCKPTAKQLKAKLISVSYNEKNANYSYKIKFTNTSSLKITKAKIHTVSELSEEVVTDKIVTLNLKPNQSKTVTVPLGKVVYAPEKENCSVKVQKIYY